MQLLLEENEIAFSPVELPACSTRGISLGIARLDLIHPIVSGNKLFKLYYFLEESLRTGRKTLVTFGGPYSNHLVATAFACHSAGICSIAVVRGERPEILSHTLQHCESYGMKLHFIPRLVFDEQKNQELFQQELCQRFGEAIIIPEGGYHPLGAKGASLIMDKIAAHNPTHVCTAVGTATTLAGLLQNAKRAEQVVAVPVIRNMTDIYDRLVYLGCSSSQDRLHIFNEFHFGGYAKKNEELIAFMNSFYHSCAVPTDFVYTAKMMFGIINKIEAGFFPQGSRVVCLHTGGLQGNDSLPKGSLVF